MKDTRKPVVFKNRQNPNQYEVFIPNSRVAGIKTWFDITNVTIVDTATGEYMHGHESEARCVPTSYKGFKRIAKKDYPKEVNHFINMSLS